MMDDATTYKAIPFQIIPYDDVDTICGGLSELAPSTGMSSVDQFARAISMGETDYEFDGMGATARAVELTDAELVMLELCAWADDDKGSRWEHDARDRKRRFKASPGCVGLDTYINLNPPREYVPAVRSYEGASSYVMAGDSDRDDRFAFIRSDDRGFWDLYLTNKMRAKELLAAWVEANAPMEDDYDDDYEDDDCTCEAQ